MAKPTSNLVHVRYTLTALSKYGELQRAVGFVRGFMAGRKSRTPEPSPERINAVKRAGPATGGRAKK